MKGLILTNAYFSTPDTEYQPLRLKEEFERLGVSITVQKNDFFPALISNGRLKVDLDYDFCVFLDKDKYIMRALERAGIPVFNRPSAIELCDDKMLTALSLSNHSIPVPDTLPGLLCYSENAKIKDETVNAVIEKLSLPVIVKESFGSLGKSVYLAKTRSELKALMEKVKCKPHLFQKFVASSSGRDIRVIGVGGNALGAMERINDDDFRSNLGAGGRARPVALTEEMRTLTTKIMDALSLDYCGIDLLFDEKGFTVCEVNSNAFFHGFENTTGINIARAYAEHIANKIKSI